MHNNNKVNPEMREARLKILIYKYLTQHLTEDEGQELQEIIRQHPALSALLERLQNEETFQKDLDEYAAIDVNKNRKRTWAAILKRRVRNRNKSILRWTGASVAAALILFIGIPFLFKQQPDQPQISATTTAPIQYDIPTGNNKTILTLANGAQIRLDSLRTGNAIGQPGSTIRKQDSGNLVYENIPQAIREGSIELRSTPPSTITVPYKTGYYNTVTTPHTGQFVVQLPDGTKAWLNKASSLRYPTSFTGSSREVELTGEAYFEVTRDPSRPFRVKVDGLAVNVLGTHFNVMAYAGKKIRTTLLTGSVQVSDGVKKQLLKPGEALTITSNKNWQLRHNVDTVGAIAWTSGYFHFAQEELADVLDELANWYDVEIDNQGGKTEPINAEISHNLTLSDVLDNLNIPYTINGKRLTILRESPYNH